MTHTQESQPRGVPKRAPARGKGKRRARQTPESQSRENKGKGNTYVRRTIDLGDVRDAAPALLFLFEAEHCWSSAEELAMLQSDVAVRSVVRRRCIARGRRAVQAATQLQRLVDAMASVLDVRARAQTAAYVTLLRAAMHFVRDDWKEALRFGSVARRLLLLLAECSDSSREEALASSFLDALDAQVRFAAYSLGDTEQNLDAVMERVATQEVCGEVVPGYAALVNALREAAPRAARSEPLELQWHGHAIAIRNPEVLDAVHRVQHEERALDAALRAAPEPHQHTGGERTRLSHAQRNAKRRGATTRALRLSQTQRADRGELDPYDRVLAALTDAEEMVRALVDENEAALHKNHSARYETAGTELRRAHEFLLYRLLSVRIARNSRLVQEVQRKSERREERAAAQFSQRTQRAGAGGQPQKHGRRRPGRSGTLSRRRAERQEREARAIQIAAAKKDRRAARALPGIVKLLESVDSALLVIGGLVIVEGEPDVSSLMEAKRFWYCALQLLHLARAFAMHQLHAEALLLVQRGELYLRQTTQTLALAEGAEKEDADFEPQLLTSGSAPVDKLSEELAQLRSDLERVFASRRTAPSDAGAALHDTRFGQTLYYHAQRHVDLDADNLAMVMQQVSLETPEAAEPEPAPAAEAAKESAAMEEEAYIPPSGAYDPANALAEEEERRAEEAAAAAKSRSWLRGWFSRS